MFSSRVLEIEGTRYRIRGLTFDELVGLGQSGISEKDSRTVVREIVHCCLLLPKLGYDEVEAISDSHLTLLARAIMDLARVNVEGKGFRRMPDDRGPPPGMIS